MRDLIRRDPRARWKARLHLGLDRTHRGLSQEQLNRVPARGEVVQIALIGNQRAGGIYHDAHRHITAALEQRFDAIAGAMTEFHYGRFDIRFKSVDALMRGDDFKIVEVNGIGGEAIDAWDPRLTIHRPIAGWPTNRRFCSRSARPTARAASSRRRSGTLSACCGIRRG